jgi:hypothetical protein
MKNCFASGSCSIDTTSTCIAELPFCGWKYGNNLICGASTSQNFLWKMTVYFKETSSSATW